MRLMQKIDKAIKEVWSNEIKVDYDNDYLLLEDSLKCAFYYHLRKRIGDEWLKANRLRIIPEYHLSDGYRSDLAIVKLVRKEERKGKHLSTCIEEIMAIIELKHKGASVINPFFEDRNKLYIYSRKYSKAQLYVGFIHEAYYDVDTSSWFDCRQTNNWAKGRVCELLGYWNENNDSFVTEIKSYNNLNEE